MSYFEITLCVLVLLCFCVHWRARTGNTSAQSSDAFRKFQRTYISVYLLATAADWLQGPHVFALYENYGLTTKQIAQLFVGGFGSSLVFGTFIGSLADKCGRRLNCLIYAFLYGAACITKHFPNYNVLMIGRILAGMATSILFSAFESWAICEHSKRDFDDESMGTLFANAVLGNSIIAVSSGFAAEIAATKYGLVAPFDVSLGVLVIMSVVMMISWNENFGEKSGNVATCFKQAIHVIRQDEKVLYLGLIQSFFEGAMYTFVLEWTPALSSDVATVEHKIPYGLIFSSFMASIMIGSAIFKILRRKYEVESYMRIIFLVAMISLASPIFLPKGHYFIYFSFLLFECCVGVFWPAMAIMRGKYIPEETRSTIMNIFRIPLNAIVIMVLLQDFPLSTIFIQCVTFLACCFIFQVALSRVKKNNTESTAVDKETVFPVQQPTQN